MPEAYERAVVADVLDGLALPKKLIHILVGPRQVGKSTAADQVGSRWRGKVVKAVADQPLPPGPEWIQGHWDHARSFSAQGTPTLLILDEVQKVRGWSESVKAQWDDCVSRDLPLHVIVLGSSSLLVQEGSNESLAGRFLHYKVNHWGYREMRDAFGWNLDKWVCFGGYPGAAPLAPKEHIWRRYIVDSLIETVLGRDVLQLRSVAKPALLRHLFLLAMSYPSQILSYNKMLGQLQEAGNATTLAHYLTLLESAFLLSGLEKFKKGILRKRGSSPKLIAWNNALVTSLSGRGFDETRADTRWWGRLVENAVGAHLLNNLHTTSAGICHWRERDREVDFVVATPNKTVAIEVKSGREGKGEGLTAFLKRYPDATVRTVGGNGIPLEEFFLSDPVELLAV